MLRAFLGPGEKQRDSQCSCEALSLHSKWGKHRNRGHPRTRFKHVCTHTRAFPLSHLSFIEALTANIHEPGTVPSKRHTRYAISFFTRRQKSRHYLLHNEEGSGGSDHPAPCALAAQASPQPCAAAEMKWTKQLCSPPGCSEPTEAPHPRRRHPLAPSATLSTVGGQTLLSLEAKP